MYLKQIIILSVLFLMSCGGSSYTPVDDNGGNDGRNTGQITDQLQIVE